MSSSYNCCSVVPCFFFKSRHLQSSFTSAVQTQGVVSVLSDADILTGILYTKKKDSKFPQNSLKPNRNASWERVSPCAHKHAQSVHSSLVASSRSFRHPKRKRSGPARLYWNWGHGRQNLHPISYVHRVTRRYTTHRGTRNRCHCLCVCVCVYVCCCSCKCAIG